MHTELNLSSSTWKTFLFSDFMLLLLLLLLLVCRLNNIRDKRTNIQKMFVILNVKQLQYLSCQPLQSLQTKILLLYYSNATMSGFFIALAAYTTELWSTTFQNSMISILDSSAFESIDFCWRKQTDLTFICRQQLLSIFIIEEQLFCALWNWNLFIKKSIIWWWFKLGTKIIKIKMNSNH